MQEEEIALAGGNMGSVHRMGDRVFRSAGFWTPAVHRLLDHCHASGLTSVPRAIEVADDGREVVSFIAGEVPLYPMPTWVWSDHALVSSARLLSQFHRAAASADQTGPWRSPSREPAEVVCHNDFAPYNLVFADGRALGVIDFDYASPGPRLWDVAYLAYRIVPITTDRADGYGDLIRHERLDRLCWAYGRSFDRTELVETVVRRLEDLANFAGRMAADLQKPELAEHARGYRADARYTATAFAAAGSSRA